MRNGFSLIQLCILLAVVGVALAATLPGGEKGSDSAKYAETLRKMETIEQAMQGWRTVNKKYPCPAIGATAPTAATFGAEAATPGTCTGTMVSGNTVGGIVPVQTLGLDKSYAVDGWGKRFTYMVDKRATGTGSSVTLVNPTDVVTVQCPSPDNSAGIWIWLNTPHGLPSPTTVTVSGWGNNPVPECPFNRNGSRTYTYIHPNPNLLPLNGGGGYSGDDPVSKTGITITAGAAGGCSTLGSNFDINLTKQDSTSGKSVMALISHGPNGHGAFLASGSATRFNAGISGSNYPAEEDNASVNVAFDNHLTLKERSDTFDDIVRTVASCPAP